MQLGALLICISESEQDGKDELADLCVKMSALDSELPDAAQMIHL